MSEREDNVCRAEMAAEAKRFDDMIAAIRSVALLNVELTRVERNLLSVAYKHEIITLRCQWRCIDLVVRKKHQYKGSGKCLSLITNFRGKLEKELRDICYDLINVLEKHLIPSAKIIENQVFYHKMMGDFRRYLAEIATGSERKSETENSLIAYKAANEIAKKNLPPINATRLGLALNFSVFYCEILKSRERAYQLAKTAYDEAMSELCDLTQENYRTSIIILQMIRNNILYWQFKMKADGWRNKNSIKSFL